MNILYIASSLDGFIAGPGGDISWLFHDGDYGFSKFMKDIGTVVMGRKTYDFGVKHSNPPFPDKKNIIITKNASLHKFSTQQVIFCSLKYLHKLLRQNKLSKNVWLVGGTALISDFINKDILDEIVLSIQPIILGKGAPLFDKIKNQKRLKLTNQKTYPGGLVQLIFKFVD